MPRGGARPGAGRPRKAASTAALSLRKRVAIAAAAGMTEREISIATGIDRDELTERYADVLEAGPAQIRLEILQALYRAALNGSVPAMRYFLRNAPAMATPPVGRKARAQQAAVGAQDGTAWADLLPSTTTRQ
jgi:hypothetical protein